MACCASSLQVYEKRTDMPRFVFHTAFDDPRTPQDAPPRASVECRAIAVYARQRAPVFYDMIHSNNAARVRIWLRLKGLEPEDAVQSHLVTYADLQSPDYARLNPLKKVPAFMDEDGEGLFESQVRRACPLARGLWQRTGEIVRGFDVPLHRLR